MKICVAQVKPVKGDIEENIKIHKRFIDRAVSNTADMVFFPELSLTGYEPKLAGDLAACDDDKKLDVFKTISKDYRITIGVGLPVVGSTGVNISMIIFRPGKPSITYSKQYLHSDELPYFVEGNEQIILSMDGKKLAPAICYESLLNEHAKKAYGYGADIYIASVAKSSVGVDRAYEYFPQIAKKYSMTVLLSNCIGECEDFESAGSSAVWNKEGIMIGKLDTVNEGLLIYDTDSEEVIIA